MHGAPAVLEAQGTAFGMECAVRSRATATWIWIAPTRCKAGAHAFRQACVADPKACHAVGTLRQRAWHGAECGRGAEAITMNSESADCKRRHARTLSNSKERASARPTVLGRILTSPTQLLIQGQWWSNSTTHRSQRRQCFALSGCDSAHDGQKPGKPAVGCLRFEPAMACTPSSLVTYPGSAKAVHVPKNAHAAQRETRPIAGEYAARMGAEQAKKTRCMDATARHIKAGRPRRCLQLEAARDAAACAKHAKEASERGMPQ
eukprot:5532359-Pleurochrysis_carterae.AAC.2